MPLPTVELIGDGMHLSPLVVQAVAGARRSSDWCMVTDAISEPVPGKELTCASQSQRRSVFAYFRLCCCQVASAHTFWIPERTREWWVRGHPRTHAQTNGIDWQVRRVADGPRDEGRQLCGVLRS